LTGNRNLNLEGHLNCGGKESQTKVGKFHLVELKMRNASLEGLADNFQTKLSHILQCIDLRDTSFDKVGTTLMQQISDELTDIEDILCLMQVHIVEQKSVLHKAEYLKSDIHAFKDQLGHISNNLPGHLPNNQCPLPSRENPKCNSASATPQIEPVHKSVQQKQTSLLPSIPYITVADFEAVPKYMKGRLTYEQINSSIDEMNKVFAAKYKLMTIPSKAQMDSVKKKIKAYKGQENKETKGVYFVVEEDIKNHSKLKRDRMGQSVITILRHCMRIKEIRGGGLTRLAIV